MTTTARVARRLAAILAIDMVGFSRLMEADEEGTIARQRAHRRDIMEPVLREHGGRIVKTTGDGLLVEFGSVVGAVDSAVRIQRAISEAEAHVPKDRRIQYRAGINLGDIVIDGDDILGDGVNIAARLESLAEPGGISVTASVFEQVVGKLDLVFDDLGNRQVKNIQKPLRVYRVRLEMVRDEEGREVGRRAGAAVKPGIAVLPFQDMSESRDQEYFADGIAEDIITGLSRYQSFFVIARNSSFTYKGRAVDVKQVAGELGARYVLEGSVRKGGSRVRITAQLIDATTGAHVWAERYDRAIGDIFDVQDEITESIVGVVAPELIGAEMQRARRKDPASLDAWENLMRAVWHSLRLTEADGIEARRFARAALALDPGLARAYVVHAMCDVWDVLIGRSADPAQTMASAHANARQAVDIDPRDAEAHSILGMVALFMRRFDEAERQLERAVSLNPNLAVAFMLGGGFYALSGEAEKAHEHLKQALRLNPRDPVNYWVYAFYGIAEWSAGRYEDAADWSRKAIQLYDDCATAHRVLAASLASLGRIEEARAALAPLFRIAPGATIAKTRAAVPWKRPEDMERYFDALRRAGMPE
ncbi:MAG TPA: adenylate/guanylate cyclase domain-containing protein [Alphaproteobacteria bacterium]|nr:adenylate/guanylate cyclase domain-containing protein [Alphaproteobacteria bacterium]